MACHHSAHTDGSPVEGMGTERVYASGLAVPSLEVRVQGPAQRDRDRDQICRVDSRAAHFDMGIVRAWSVENRAPQHNYDRLLACG